MDHFNTNIVGVERVIALSDIHADIHSLIVSLRDCAKVIKMNQYYNHDELTYSDQTEELLNVDISVDDGIYMDDLYYEWCGDSTHVVIIGDIIDGKRRQLGTAPNTSPIKNINQHEHEYPQIEIKILRFINSINQKALASGGKIIKLLGNHEVMNIIDENVNRAANYIFDNDSTNPNYYQGFTRQDIFKVGYPGFQLLFEGGCGVLIKVNNSIFVHGSLPYDEYFIGKNGFDYNYFSEINNYINNPANIRKFTFLRQVNPNYHIDNGRWNEILNELNVSISTDIRKVSPLWIRANRDTEINERLYQKLVNGDPLLSDEFCEDQIDHLTRFKMTSSGVITEDVADLRIVVGHCIQSDSTVFENRQHIDPMNQGTQSNSSTGINTTYGNIIDSDSVSETFSYPTYTGYSDIDNNIIFGISMECPKDSPRNNDHYIYRVDIGSSRGFDANAHISEASLSRHNESKYLKSRTPQVLEIYDEHNIITIIKSKIRNTRIHVPRPSYENAIIANNTGELNMFHTVPIPYYQKKYLKYKNKYLALQAKYLTLLMRIEKPKVFSTPLTKISTCLYETCT
jgi:hypothetical protein